jgi:parallel beta-helix repeat protein
MDRRIFAVWACLLILLSIIIIIDVSTDILLKGKGATLYVGGAGPGNFTTIQLAIDNASSGDTVFVYNGTYFENVNVNKTINLVGEDRNNTIIDGKGIGDVIYVTSNWVNITGFTINHSGSQWGQDAGIQLSYSNNTSVMNCSLSNNLYGLMLEYSNNNTIENNTVQLNDLGIYLQYSLHNSFTKNEIANNEGGIGLHYSSSNRLTNNSVTFNINTGIIIGPSSDNIIDFNNITNNNWGITVHGDSNYRHNISFNNICGNYIGILITNPSMPITTESSGHTLSNNYVHNNTIGIGLETADAGVIEEIDIIKSDIMENDIGIALQVFGGAIEGVKISQCHIENNRIGIHMYQIYTQNIISHNNISKNDEYAIYLNNSMYNQIYLNNFFNNNAGGPQVYDNTGLNFWNTTYPTGGNHWDDYYGRDDCSGPNQDQPGCDGIGDTPHTQFDGSAGSKDYYPHINPIGNVIFLYEGWNLISLPLVQSDTDLAEVLLDINKAYDTVQWYNASDSADHWKHNHTLKPNPLNDMEKIDHYMGFWIHITEPGGVLFEYSGSQPIQNQTIPLHPGWNMVGFPSLSNTNRTNALNNLTFGSNVDSIWAFNASSQKWLEINSLDHFKPRYGYWIHATKECVWEVPL